MRRALHRTDGFDGAAMDQSPYRKHKKVSAMTVDWTSLDTEACRPGRAQGTTLPLWVLTIDCHCADAPRWTSGLQWPVPLTPVAYRRDRPKQQTRAGTALAKSASLVVPPRWSTAGNTSAHAPEGAKKESSGTPALKRTRANPRLEGCKSLFGDDLCRYLCRRGNRLGTTGACRFWRRRAMSGVDVSAGREGAWQAPDLRTESNHPYRPIYWRGTRGLVSPETADPRRLQTAAKTAAAGDRPRYKPLGF